MPWPQQSRSELTVPSRSRLVLLSVDPAGTHTGAQEERNADCCSLGTSRRLLGPLLNTARCRNPGVRLCLFPECCSFCSAATAQPGRLGGTSPVPGLPAASREARLSCRCCVTALPPRRLLRASRKASGGHCQSPCRGWGGQGFPAILGLSPSADTE